MRSKEEIEKLLEQYDKAVNGDADAMIFMSKLLLGLSDKGGVNDGKDIKRTGRGNKAEKKGVFNDEGGAYGDCGGA